MSALFLLTRFPRLQEIALPPAEPICLGLGLVRGIGSPTVALPIERVTVANEPAGYALPVCPVATISPSRIASRFMGARPAASTEAYFIDQSWPLRVKATAWPLAMWIWAR